MCLCVYTHVCVHNALLTHGHVHAQKGIMYAHLTVVQA